MSNKVFIKEIFESIQGEGPYIGVKQLFVRFSKCNLNCKYCDTDFKTDLKEYDTGSFVSEINSHNNIHSISLTGGEPLMEADFLSEALKKINGKIYLETNGTLYNNLEKIINYIDIISMDIKIQSAAQMPNLFKEHKKFIETAKSRNNIDIFLKVVFDKTILDKEIQETINLAKINNLLIVLQPKTKDNKIETDTNTINNIYNKFSENYEYVRLIPQVHKFMDIR